MRYRRQEILKGGGGNVLKEGLAEGEARISVYVVCRSSYAGFIATYFQCRDGHDRLWLCLQG